MSNEFTRRDLLKSSGLILGTGILAPQLVFADVSKPTPSSNAEAHSYDFLSTRIHTAHRQMSREQSNESSAD